MLTDKKKIDNLTNLYKASQGGILRSTHILFGRKGFFPAIMILKVKNMEGFRMQSKAEWLDILGVDETTLNSNSLNTSATYSLYKKKKKVGFREIYCINKNDPIYDLQNRIQNSFLANIYFPECVFGFIKGKSYLDYLAPHATIRPNRFFLRIDIKSFFDNIQIDNIKESLSYYFSEDIPDNVKEYILDTFIKITTCQDKFVQGAVTSPTISNLALRQMDIRIERYCNKLGVTYTRYADDLLFSSEKAFIHERRFINMIQKILYSKSFSINYSKLLKSKNEISINGYVVGTDLHLSRKKLCNLNKNIYDIRSKNFHGFANESVKNTVKNRLAGYRAYLIQINRYSNNKCISDKNGKKIEEIESLLLNKAIFPCA